MTDDIEATSETTDEPLGAPGLKALQAERDARAAAEKRLAELEQLQKEREDAELTEVQRLNRQVEEAAAAREQSEKAAANAALTLLRYQVAAEKGIPSAWVPRLQGDSREALEADADALLPSLNLNLNPTPKADPSQGSHDGSGKPLTTAEQFAQQVDF